MTKLNVVLALALIASALLLVHTAYDARRLYSALDRAQQEQRTLEADAQRLDAERQAAATNARVERVARERLQMRTATPAVTQYVADPGASK
jgi:cell division protein FtsL